MTTAGARTIDVMGLGTGIFLLVVGAILTFAVRDGVSGVDLTAVGWICMGAGALSLLLVLATGRPRGTATSTTYVERHDGVPPGA